MVLHRHILNKKFTITRHRNILRGSGNEKKTITTKYFLRKIYIYIYIYIYILLEHFVLNIYIYAK